MAASHKLLLWASETSRSSTDGTAAGEARAAPLYPSPPGSPIVGSEIAMRTPLRHLIKTLYRGVFEQGQDISDKIFLASAAVEAGLARDHAQALRWLDSTKADEILAERTATPHEVSAVPCFVVQDKFKVGGAQPPEVFLQVFERIQREQTSLVPVV